LIIPRREDMRVIYRAEANEELDAAPILLEAVREAFAKKVPAKIIFRACTAFTHERRIEIIRVLTTNGPQTFGDLLEATGMSSAALWNHLDKLSDRGFVRDRERCYRLMRIKDPLRSALIRAVCS